MKHLHQQITRKLKITVFYTTAVACWLSSRAIYTVSLCFKSQRILMTLCSCVAFCRNIVSYIENSHSLGLLGEIVMRDMDDIVENLLFASDGDVRYLLGQLKDRC